MKIDDKKLDCSLPFFNLAEFLTFVLKYVENAIECKKYNIKKVFYYDTLDDKRLKPDVQWQSKVLEFFSNSFRSVKLVLK